MTWKVLFQKYDENDGYFSDSFNIINTKLVSVIKCFLKNFSLLLFNTVAYNF